MLSVVSEMFIHLISFKDLGKGMVHLYSLYYSSSVLGRRDVCFLKICPFNSILKFKIFTEPLFSLTSLWHCLLCVCWFETLLMLLVWYCQYFLQFTKHRVHPLNTNIYVTLISDLCFCLMIGWCLENRMLAFIIFLENSPPHTSLIFQLYNSIMHFFSTLLTEMIPLEHN